MSLDLNCTDARHEPAWADAASLDGMPTIHDGAARLGRVPDLRRNRKGFEPFRLSGRTRSSESTV
jgi:hypothetical protein